MIARRNQLKRLGVYQKSVKFDPQFSKRRHEQILCSRLGGIYIESFGFTNFWDDDGYALREYVCNPPSDELIAELEVEFGYKLPESYIWLMKRHNGGIPVNTCCPTDEPTSWAEDHAAITGIMAISRKKYGVGGEYGQELWIEDWG